MGERSSLSQDLGSTEQPATGPNIDLGSNSTFYFRILPFNLHLRTCLVLSPVTLAATGRYRCEVINILNLINCFNFQLYEKKVEQALQVTLSPNLDVFF